MTVASQQAYRADVDGLRAISILLVLLYHGFAEAIPGGFIGVDVFFVISGYLITSQIYGQARSGVFSFPGFYARRIRRIFPPLIAVLVFAGTYAYFHLNLNHFSSLFKHIASSSVFISNFVLWHETGYFDQQAELKPLLHLWSLGIEEQFYVFWPVLLIALIAASRAFRGAVSWGLLLVCAASVAAGANLVGQDPNGAFYSPLSRCWQLGVGGLLAVLEFDRSGAPVSGWCRRAKEVAAAGGGVCLVVCAVLLSEQSQFPSLATALPALSALAMIAAGPDAWVNRQLLACRPMVWLGLISYGLYLWHWPLLSFLRIGNVGQPSAASIWLALAASVVLAALTRAVLESPIRNCRARSLPVWLASALALVGMVGLLGWKSELFWPQRLLLQAGIQEQIRTAWREFNSDGIPNSDCAGLAAADTAAYRSCRIWGAPSARPTVVVWGDSMSVAWMPPFFALAREHGWRVIQFSHTGCPPILNVRRTDLKDVECRDAAMPAQIVEAIRRAKPDVVFLIARWNLYYHGHIKNDVLVDDSFITDGPGAADAVSAKGAFERNLPETMNQLSEFSRLVVFKDTPVLKVPVDVGMSLRPGTFEPRVEEMARFEAEINSVLDAAAANAPNAVTFDPTVRLCDGSRCPAYLDGLPAYFDEVHPTAHATMQFLHDIESLGAAR